MHAVVLLEKEGATYEKDRRGNPILPPFRVAEAKLPEGDLPPFAKEGPIWKSARADSLSRFSSSMDR